MIGIFRMDLELQVVINNKYYITGFYIPSENVIVTGYELIPHKHIISSCNGEMLPEKVAYKLLNEGRTVRSDLLSSDLISFVKSKFPTLNALRVVTSSQSDENCDNGGGLVRGYIEAADTVNMLIEYFRFFVMNISREMYNMTTRIDKEWIELVLSRAEEVCEIYNLENETFVDVVKRAYSTPYFDQGQIIYGRVDGLRTLKACIENTRVFLYNIFRTYKKHLLSPHTDDFYTQGSKIPNYVFQLSETELIRKTNSQMFSDFLGNNLINSNHSLTVFPLSTKVLVCQEAMNLEEAVQINLTHTQTQTNILRSPQIFFRDIDPRVIWTDDEVYSYTVQVNIMDTKGHTISSEERVVLMKVEIQNDERYDIVSSVIKDGGRFFGYLYSMRK